MDEELKNLLIKAKSSGASDSDMISLIDMYESDKVKKKAVTSASVENGASDASIPRTKSTTDLGSSEPRPKYKSAQEAITGSEKGLDRDPIGRISLTMSDAQGKTGKERIIQDYRTLDKLNEQDGVNIEASLKKDSTVDFLDKIRKIYAPLSKASLFLPNAYYFGTLGGKSEEQVKKEITSQYKQDKKQAFLQENKGDDLDNAIKSIENQRDLDNEIAKDLSSENNTNLEYLTQNDKVLEDLVSQYNAKYKDVDDKKDYSQKEVDEHNFLLETIKTKVNERIGTVNSIKDVSAQLKITKGDFKDKQEEIDFIKSNRESSLKQIGRGISTGLNDLGVMVAAIPENYYRMFAWPQNAVSEALDIPSLQATPEKFGETVGVKNKVLDFYQEEVSKLEQETQTFNKRYKDSGIYENIKKGNYSDAFELLGAGIARSAPVSLTMMVGGAALGSTGKLSAVATPFFMGDQVEKLKEDDPGISELEATTKALGMAGAETVFASIGKVTIGKVYKDILLKEGKEQGVKVFKNGLIEMYKKAIEKYGLAATSLGNGIEEVATTISQNMTQGKPAFENVPDSFIQGIGSGAVYGAPITALQARKAVSEGISVRRTAKKINNSKYSDITSVFNDGDKFSDFKIELVENKSTRTALEKELKAKVKNDEITEEAANEVLEDFSDTEKVVGSLKGVDLTQTQKVKAAELLKKKSRLEKITKDKDQNLVSKEVEEIKNINKQLSNLRNIDYLPEEDKKAYKDQAAKELQEEFGEGEDYSITDKQITDRANEIFIAENAELDKINKEKQEELDSTISLDAIEKEQHKKLDEDKEVIKLRKKLRKTRSGLERGDILKKIQVIEKRINKEVEDDVEKRGLKIISRKDRNKISQDARDKITALNNKLNKNPENNEKSNKESSQEANNEEINTEEEGGNQEDVLNEAQTQGDIATDGNVRPEPKPSKPQGKSQAVQPAVKPEPSQKPVGKTQGVEKNPVSTPIKKDWVESDFNALSKEVGINNIGSDLYIKPDADIESLINKYGNFAVRIKDANGYSAEFSAIEFQGMIKSKTFSDRVKQIQFVFGGRDQGIPEGFMSDIRKGKELLLTDGNISKKIELPWHTSLLTKSTVSPVKAKQIIEAINNADVQHLLSALMIKSIVIEKPGALGLSEQGNYNKKTKTLKINADLDDPLQTILHEIGHERFDNLSEKNKEELREIAGKDERVTYQNSIDEFIVDNFYQNNNYYNRIKETKGDIPISIESSQKPVEVKEEILIFDDPAENESANEKLEEQDNAEQEPDVAAIESETETTESLTEPETEEKLGRVQKKIDDATDVERKPISEISTDEKRFQGRGGLNDDVVNEIGENFNDADQDPIHVWTDPKTKKTYVLSGHHRLAGAKKAGRTDVKIVDRTNDFSEKQAKKFAIEDANANRTMETPLERAAALRKKRKKGDSKEDIDAFKKREGRNKTFIENLSFLNPKGPIVQTLKAFQKTTDKQNQNEIEKIADWIGDARKRNKDLTDAHEKELLNFLNNKDQSKRFTSKSDFLTKVNSITSEVFFDANKRLNIARFKNKTEGENQYDKEVEDQKQKVNDLETKKSNIKNRLNDPANPQYVDPKNPDYANVVKTANKLLDGIEAGLKVERAKLAKIYQQKGKYTNAGSNQTGLFNEPVETKSKEKSKLASLKESLDKLDKDLGQFGKETLGDNLPIVVAQGAVKAMKAEITTAETVADVAKIGYDYIKSTDWYKKLSKSDQKQITPNTVLNDIRNANLTESEGETQSQGIGFGKNNDRDSSLGKGGPVRVLDAIQQKAKRFWNQTFKTNAGTTKEVGNIVRSLGRELSSITNALEHELSEIGKILKATSSKKKNNFNTNALAINDYLLGVDDVDISFLNSDQIEKLDALRNRVDSLSDKMNEKLDIQKSELESKLKDYKEGSLAHQSITDAIQRVQNLQDTIEANKGKYLHRSYDAFKNKDYLSNLTSAKVNKEGRRRIDNAVQHLMDESTDLFGSQITEADARKKVFEYLESLKTKDDFISSMTTGQADAPFLKKRKDIPKVFRELLGESNDPLMNYASTVFKISKHIASLEYQENMKKYLLDTGMGTYEAQAGYTKLTSDGDAWKGLSGIYVSQDLYNSIQDLQPLSAITEDFYKLWVAFAAFTKLGKTALSPQTTARNSISGIILGLNAGFFFASNPKIMKDAFTMAWGTKKSIKELRSETDKLYKFGILGDGAVSQEIMKTMNDFANDLERISNRGTGKSVYNAIKKIYALGDDFYKVIGYYTYKARYIKSGMSSLEAEAKAAQRIVDTFPTYSMLPKNIKRLRRFPFTGTFVSFPWESVRTSFNTFGYMQEDLKAGRTSMFAKQAAGFLIANATHLALGELSKNMMGFDDDDDDKIRDMLPFYQTNSKLIYMGKDKFGQPIFMDATALFPAEVYLKPLRTLFDDREGRDIQDNINETLKETLSPYLGLDISYKTVNELIFNRDVYDRQIYEGENLLEGVFNDPDKVSQHYLKNAGPGFYGTITEFARANEIQPSFFGDKFTSYGKEYNNSDALMGVLGFRFTTFNYASGMTSLGYDNKGTFEEKKQNITGAFRTTQKMDKESISDAVEEYKEANNELSESLIIAVKGARKLGMKEQVIFKAFKKTGFSQKDVLEIMQGYPIPLKEISEISAKKQLDKIELNYNDKKKIIKLEINYLKNIATFNTMVKESNLKNLIGKKD